MQYRNTNEPTTATNGYDTIVPRTRMGEQATVERVVTMWLTYTGTLDVSP